MFAHVPTVLVPVATLVAAALLVGLTASCASDGAGPPLSATAEHGRQIARSEGCAACHGSAGQGGVGPAFVGLYGSDVTLEDGTTVVADATYLAEAIRTPGASRTDGYKVTMPSNDLSDEDVESVIAYIRELTGEATP